MSYVMGYHVSMAASGGSGSVQSALVSAFEEADLTSQKMCLAGAWLATLSEDDRSYLQHRIDTLPNLTVYRAIAGLVNFSDKTWKRHLSTTDRCICYTSGALTDD